jgi:WD40 repeat protein
MHTQRTIIGLASLFTGCGFSKLPLSVHSIDTGDSATGQVLVGELDTGVEPDPQDNCTMEAGAEALWDQEMDFYGIWGQVFSYDPAGEQIALRGSYYDPSLELYDAHSGDHIATVADDEYVNLRDETWTYDLRGYNVVDVETDEVLFEIPDFRRHRGNASYRSSALAISPTGARVAVFGEDDDVCTLQLWSTESEAIETEILPDMACDIPGLTGILTAEDVLYFTTNSETLQRVDFVTGGISHVETGPVSAYHADRTAGIIWTVGFDGIATGWDDLQLTERFSLEVAAITVNENIFAEEYAYSPMAFSADGSLWASLDEDGQPVVRRRCDNEVVATLTRLDEWSNWSTEQAYGLAFSPDGSRLSAAFESGLGVWSVESW